MMVRVRFCVEMIAFCSSIQKTRLSVSLGWLREIETLSTLIEAEQSQKT